MRSKPSIHALRIIGGKWRGRKVSFPVDAATGGNTFAIRPTGDRIRETLFNWLAPYIHDSTCLDLFAGSGLLSIEALSRGARKVTLLDNQKRHVDAIEKNLADFQASAAQFECLVVDSFQWIQQSAHSQYDIIFVDPPFEKDLIYVLCQSVEASGLTKNGTLIYLEAPDAIHSDRLPKGWVLLKHKRAGKVHYGLCRVDGP